MTSTQPLAVRPPAPPAQPQASTQPLATSSADEAARAIEARAPRPHITQVVASALAAVSSTVALSYLGVAGTIVGAAVASVMTVFGNFVYQRSLLHTQQKVANAMRAGARMGAGRPDGTAQAANATVAGASVARAEYPETGSAERNDAERDAVVPDDLTVRRRRAVRRRLIVASLGLFVAIVGAVTAFEFLAGKPLTDVLHGTSGSGTSISSVHHSRGGSSGNHPAPAPTESSKPVTSSTDSGSSSNGETKPTTAPTSGTGSTSKDSTGTGDGSDKGADKGKNEGNDTTSSGSTSKSPADTSTPAPDPTPAATDPSGTTSEGKTDSGSGTDPGSESGSADSSSGTASDDPTAPSGANDG